VSGVHLSKEYFMQKGTPLTKEKKKLNTILSETGVMSLYTKPVLTLLTSICLFFSSFYLLLPVLPLYVQSIGGTLPDVGIVVGVFTLSSVLSRPVTGVFTDRYGRKLMLVAGALIFFIAPFLYFLASTVNFLLLVRMFHGLGIAAFTVSSVAMIADISPPHRRGEAFGAFGLSAMVALAAAPAGGSWLLTTFSFEAVFSAAAVLAGGCVLLSCLVKETFHLSESKKKITVEPQGFIPSVIIFLCTVTYGSVVAFLPFFAHKIPEFGLYYTAYALSSIIIRIPVGKISDRVGRQKIILFGLGVMCVSLGVLSFSHSLALLLFSGGLYGIGFSSVYPTLTALLVDRIPEESRAMSISYFTASFDLGIAGGSVVFGFFPLLSIYPAGALIVGLGVLLFYSCERSSFSNSL
jgi:MFS family permease